MLSPKYQRHIEDFICENCGLKVIGNGFTNHCPNCLWSKHVDINPGDRAEACKGMMKPVAIELRNGLYYVLQRCVLCGFERKNQVKDNDN
ncbi:MAG: RNHCP domain-containing protein, partial [Patescibacteria group bacterium]|nr:RNHCP domain-containing protein [Patescibacteria group bacterium]